MERDCSGKGETGRPVKRLVQTEVRLLDSSGGRGEEERGWIWAMGLADRFCVEGEEKRGTNNVL